MAQEREEDKKNQGGEEPAPVAEAILGSDLNKDDQTVEAEASIRSVVVAHLEEFSQRVDGALDGLESFLLAQTADAQTTLNDPGFLDALGDRYVAALLHVGGGGKAPLMGAMAREVDDTVSWASVAEHDAAGMLYHMRRAVRDACWYVRDNAQAILANEWTQLLDLAAEGSFDFVPALIHLGLPSYDFNPTEFSGELVHFAQSWQKSHETAKEQVADQAPKDAEKEEEAQKEQELMQQDEEKQQVAAAV